MSSLSKARIVFAAGVALLLLSGLATSIIIVRLSQSAERIGHTYDVQVAIGEVDGIMAAAARARFSFVNIGGPNYLQAFDAAGVQLTVDLQHVRDLTKDNPAQQYLCTRLENLARRRMDLLKSAIDLTKSGHSSERAQAQFSRDSVNVASDLDSVIHEMQVEEERSLGERAPLSGKQFEVVAGVLFGTLIVSLLLFWLHSRLLLRALAESQSASGGNAGRPGPLKIEASQMSGDVYNLANKE
jgi:CHASE3 domain sensor protein